MALRRRDLGDALPHLSRPEAGVAEAIDESGHDLAALFRRAFGQQRAADHHPEVEALDALCRPVRRELFGADAPHLFGVGLEEDAVQPPAELVAHPVLEGLRVLDWKKPRPKVAGKAPGGLDGAEVPERVDRLDGVSEEAAAIVDAGKPAAAEHLVAEDLGPQGLDLLVLGEEPVTADVEPVALV